MTVTLSLEYYELSQPSPELHPVDEDVQAHPHDINKVPVPGDRFEGEVFFW